MVYPLGVSKTEMIVLLPHSEDSWQPGHFGIMEPLRELSEEIRPEDIDLVVCPCTAFDAECGRLGMGGGFYDRFLPRCTRVCIVSVAFAPQEQPCHALVFFGQEDRRRGD